MTYYNVRKINKKKCGDKLTQEMFETLQQVFDNLQDVTCSISEVQDISLTQIARLNDSYWKLYRTFNFEENKK